MQVYPISLDQTGTRPMQLRQKGSTQAHKGTDTLIMKMLGADDTFVK